VKLPEELTDYVAYIAQKRLMGYRSMIEFTSACVRKEVQYLQQLGVVPSTVPKVRTVAPGAIGVLSAVLLVAVVGMLAILPGGPTGFGVLSDAFSPLADWDVQDTYQRFHGFINFVLYFVAFFTLVFAGCRKQFPRREATMLASAFGLALAVALSLVPTNWIQAISPFALLLFILLLFWAVFRGLQHFGLGQVSAGALAYVLGYVLVLTHQPDLLTRAGGFGAFLRLAFLAALVLAIYQVVVSFYRGSGDVFAHATHAARTAWTEAFGSDADKQTLAQEQAQVRDALQLQPKAYRSTQELESAISKSEQAVRTFGHSPEALATVADELRALRAQTTELGERLGKLQSIATRLQAMDLELFTKLKATYAKLSKPEQKRVAKAIKQRVAQLKLEAVLPKLARSATNSQRQADRALATATTLLERNKPQEALRALDKARFNCAQLKGILTQLNDIEESIQALLKRTLRYFK
jgi:hypothetical protein